MMHTQQASLMALAALLAAGLLGTVVASGGAGAPQQCTTQGSVMLQSSQRRVVAHVFEAEERSGFCCFHGDACGSCTSQSRPGDWCHSSAEHCAACSTGASFWCDHPAQSPVPAPAPTLAPAPLPSTGGGHGGGHGNGNGGHGGGNGSGHSGGLEGRCDSEKLPKDSRCTGCPPRFNGKLCASTTRYNDMTKGACGCGDSEPVPADWWTLTTYTAALNCKNLDPANPLLSWCPAGCGGCFEVCSTGGTTSGKTTKAGVCRVFTITNRCGDGYKEYPEWCSQELSYQECEKDPSKCQQFGSTNNYGYPAHFDLQDYHLQVSSELGWDNVEVTFEPVPCSRWNGGERKCSHCRMVDTGNWQSLFQNITA